jgi:hypothetical protein
LLGGFMLIFNELPENLDMWYKASSFERDAWITGTTDQEIKQTLAKLIISDAQQSLGIENMRRYTTRHPRYPQIFNLEIAMNTIRMAQGDAIFEQHRPTMLRQFRLEQDYPNASLQEIAIFTLVEDFGMATAIRVAKENNLFDSMSKYLTPNVA